MPETLVAALTELEKSYKDIQKDASFQVFDQTSQLVASAVSSCMQCAPIICMGRRTLSCQSDQSCLPIRCRKNTHSC